MKCKYQNKNYSIQEPVLVTILHSLVHQNGTSMFQISSLTSDHCSLHQIISNPDSKLNIEQIGTPGGNLI